MGISEHHLLIALIVLGCIVAVVWIWKNFR
jgi:hypothetical protein